MVTLNKPSAGDTDWAGEINSNWSSIESALNVSMSAFENIPYRVSISNITNVTVLSQRPLFVPFRLDHNLVFNQLAVEVARSTSGSNLFTVHAGIYTYPSSTQIALLGSAANTYSNSATASVSGTRHLLVTGFEAGATALTPGNYALMLYFSAANTASMNYNLRGAQTVSAPQGLIGPGANNVTTATSQLSSLNHLGWQFQGRYVSTTNAPPSAVPLASVSQWTSGISPYFRLALT